MMRRVGVGRILARERRGDKQDWRGSPNAKVRNCGDSNYGGCNCSPSVMVKIRQVSW